MEDKTKKIDIQQFKGDVLYIENEKLKLELKLKSEENIDYPDKLVVLEEIHKVITEVFGDKKEREEVDPEAILKTSMKQLKKVEDLQYVLENLVEAIKRGEGSSTVLARFHDQGLIKTQPSPNEDSNKEEAFNLLLPLDKSSPGFNSGDPKDKQKKDDKPEEISKTVKLKVVKEEDGKASNGFCKWVLDLIKGPLRKVAMRLKSILINALCVIPKFVGIEPVIGFTGFLPSISFIFKAETVDLRELIEMLSED